MKKIPVYQPSITALEKKFVNQCLDSSWISSKGDFLPLFEHEFSKRVGVRHSTAVCNGTVALHLALVSLGIGPGDEVIVPTLTYIASVNAIRYTGAKEVFADSRVTDWQVDPVEIERKISKKTKAIMVVHLYGHPCEMDAIGVIAKKHNLFVIEDCAEAFGSSYKGRPVGSFGHISTFSFFGNKTITTGEGGMVCTNDASLYERTVHLKGQGLAANRTYWHDVVGFNYRMTNICAAIGLAQLQRADELLLKKRKIFERYQTGLHNAPVEFHRGSSDVVHSYWMVSILVGKDVSRESLVRHLTAFGIETRPVFYPVHTMPMYVNGQSYPVAEDISRRGINLPSWPDLTYEDVEFISEKIRFFIKC